MSTYPNNLTITQTLPSLTEPGRIIVIGRPHRSLDEVVSHLATLPSVIAWNPEALTLNF